MDCMSNRAGDESSRRVIDVAVGILVGLRGYSDREAFEELVRVVNQTGIGIGSLGSGLVALASGSSSGGHAEAFIAWVNCCDMDAWFPQRSRLGHRSTTGSLPVINQSPRSRA
jgi:hypothetical protein